MVWWCCGYFASWLYVEKAAWAPLWKMPLLPLWQIEYSEFYLLSVYLHPDRVWRKIWNQWKGAWENLDSWLMLKMLSCWRFQQSWWEVPLLCGRSGSALPDHFDVHPTLGTYRHPRQVSPLLERCLVPEDWVSSARWNPVIFIFGDPKIQTTNPNYFRGCRDCTTQSYRDYNKPVQRSLPTNEYFMECHVPGKSLWPLDG